MVKFKELWLSHLNDKISFLPAKEEITDESNKKTPYVGGCDSVKALVKWHNERHQHQKAFGVVDRDTLLNNRDQREELFFEPNDEIFREQQCWPNIYVHTHWEIENHLLHTDFLLDRIKAIDPDFTLDTAAIENLAVQASMKKSLLSFFSDTKNKKINIDVSCTEEEFEQLATQRFEVTVERCRELKQKMRQFMDESEQAENRWNQLIRVLDGKGTLLFLNNHLNLRTTFWNAGESYFFFKSWYDRSHFIPDEITWILQDICKQTRIHFAAFAR